MTSTEKALTRKALAGFIITEELEYAIKGTVHVAWIDTDCRISVVRHGKEIYHVTYDGLGSFVATPYCLSSDLDLIVDDVIKEFTNAIKETFFKNI